MSRARRRPAGPPARSHCVCLEDDDGWGEKRRGVWAHVLQASRRACRRGLPTQSRRIASHPCGAPRGLAHSGGPRRAADPAGPGNPGGRVIPPAPVRAESGGVRVGGPRADGARTGMSGYRDRAGVRLKAGGSCARAPEKTAARCEGTCARDRNGGDGESASACSPQSSPSRPPLPPSVPACGRATTGSCSRDAATQKMILAGWG